jgi:hypothetical protein
VATKLTGAKRAEAREAGVEMPNSQSLVKPSFRDRLLTCLGDLHPDDRFLSTIEGYVRHAARGKPVDDQAGQLTDREAVGQ